MSGRLRLNDGDRVCIVGGGPAGSFAALHLLDLARKRGLALDVLVFEPRDFAKPGPGGCNRCAGILSSRLISGLRSLGLTLPEDVIQADLKAYAIYLNNDVMRLDRPDPDRPILSVYRGSGPRLLQDEPLASFDGFLLSQVTAHGGQHIPSRVRKVGWDDRPVVHTARGEFHADLLVLATGVNSHAPLEDTYGYRSPKTEVMAQDEILRPATWPEDQVSAFFSKPRGLTFGALIPKGKYLNISLLGRGMTRDAVSEFYDAQTLDSSLGAFKSLCGCTPRISVRPGKRYFGDRWVAVGDAAVTRLYKDGIGSAFFTAKTAITVAVTQGLSHAAFRRGYAPHCNRVAVDNIYGRMLFRIWSMTLHNPRMLRVWINAIRREANEQKEGRVHIRVLWGMFTGDELYRDLFWRALSLGGIKGLLRSWRD